MKLADFKVADSFSSRLLGIMFRRKLEKPLLFVFDSEAGLANSIHSLFVFVEFDAVFLDGKKRVVDIRRGIRPFTPMIVPKAAAKYLVEAPAGWAKRNRVKLGMTISF